MRTSALDALAELDAHALTAFIRRRCAWCSSSLTGKRRDAHFCSTAHRCRAWRHRRACCIQGAVTADHQTSLTPKGMNP